MQNLYLIMPKNNGIPIWGTCLGMQMITKFMADDNKPLDKYDNIGLKKVELTISKRI